MKIECDPIKRRMILRRFPDLIDWDFVHRLEYKNIEELMMESFLRDMGEDIKNEWKEGVQEKFVRAEDITEELKDLLKVYTDSEDSLKKREDGDLATMQYHMKRYLKSYEDRVKVSEKLSKLKSKMDKDCKEGE